jgi:DtxR family transcriptional regulator, Mn-dependent transcriptional regulator
MLTPAQEDYIESIYRLELSNKTDRIRITDIAEQLGTRLPTVTRTVQKLTSMGFINHSSRKEVSLTDEGRRLGKEILHRHKDLVMFFTEILGISEENARSDACQVEHGVSKETAQRIHEFLEYYSSLDEKDRMFIEKFKTTVYVGKDDFNELPENKTDGWRM